MVSISNFQLNHVSLIAYFALPFAVYGMYARYWFLPRKLKVAKRVLFIVSLGAIIFAGLKLIEAIQLTDLDLAEVAVLHVLPPLLAIFAMTRGALSPINSLSQNAHASDSVQYQPKSETKLVEKISWDEIVISEQLKSELQAVVKLLKDPKGAREYGIEVPKGILLAGPPGTGKTTLARVIASNAELSFFSFHANEIVSKWVGESEKNLSRLFEVARENAPAVIFIDEVDSLGKKRSEKNAAHSDNLLNHLLQLMDGVVKSDGIYVVAATNRPELVDDALKRAGRLERVIEIGLPDKETRKELFQLFLNKLKLANDVDISILADVTHGNSAADIKSICNQAGLRAYQREEHIPDKQKSFLVTSEDLEYALSQFALDEEELEEIKSKTSNGPVPLNDQIESITWDDLIVSDSLKNELKSVIELLKDPTLAGKYGIDVPKGILLNGPPGTGKTTLAKAIANTAGLSFFVLQTDEIVSKWVGDSERNLTQLFKAASKHAPAVIFIDEVDSIGKNRAEGNAQHADNLLNHLLQLIDGVIKREGVYVIAATNRADLVDPALKRGGRLSRVIEVPLPNLNTRRALFELYMKRLNLSDEVDLEWLAKVTKGRSGADIKEICNLSGLNAFQREASGTERNYQVSKLDVRNAVMAFLPVPKQVKSESAVVGV